MPDEAAAQTTGPANQSQESAPGNNASEINGGAKVETTPKQTDGAAPAVKREFFKLREKVRGKEDEIASLRAELDALKASGTGKGPTQKVDPLEDPDGFETSLTRKAEKAAEAKFNELLSRHNVTNSAVQSEQWLRSRSHLQEDGRAADEVAEIIASNYSHLVSVDPRAAARSAYSDWCEMKGVNPDLSSNSSPTPPRHAKASAAGSGASDADKTYTPEEVKRTLAGLTDPKAIAAFEAKVVKAAKEGRYKGTSYKLR